MRIDRGPAQWRHNVVCIALLTFIFFGLVACAAGTTPADDAENAPTEEPGAAADTTPADDAEDVTPEEPGVEIDIVLPDADVDDVVNESDVVVRGTVVALDEDIRNRFSPDGNMGYTLFTIEVEEALVGKLSERLVSESGEIDIPIWTHEDGSRIQAYESGGPVDLQVGDITVWFLRELDPKFDYSNEVYAKAHFYGVLWLMDDGTLMSRNPKSPIGREVVELRSLNAVEERIRRSQ